MTFELRAEARFTSAYDDPPVEGEEDALGAFLVLIRKEQRLPRAATVYFGPPEDEARQSDAASIMWGDNEANRAFTTGANEAVAKAVNLDGQ